MTDTASGLLRVVVLIVATSMFAVAWSGDQQTQQNFIIARKESAQQARQLLARRSVRNSALNREVRIRPEETGYVSNVESAGSLETSVSYVTRVEIEMRLPRGIPAGRYQVVDESGHCQMIHIRSSVNLAEVNVAEERDIYILDLPHGSRSVFIRVSQADDPLTASVSNRWE